LAPFNTFRTWRTLVLELTALEHTTTTTQHHHPETAIPTTTQVTTTAPRTAVAASPSGSARGTGAAALESVAPPAAGPRRGYPVSEEPAPVSAEVAWSTEPTERANQRTDQRTADQRTDDERADDLAEHGDEQRQDRRSVDPRVLRLARYLLDAPDADEVTGEMVGGLLGIEVAPRTGRRLLGQARELVQGETEADGQRTLELATTGR
ncbi:MAG TPA: hypothetical protein VNP03_28760, partial [Pseudonocardia sp.]|nr:hypothetical protein [Pseudonocardia sp.]